MSWKISSGADPSWELSVPRGVSLYVGALLGPGLLILPGIAGRLAGPASIVAWAGLLGISGLFAAIFTALGMRFAGGGGVIEYTAAGLGTRVGRAVGWCFVTAVTLGAPLVCLIGAGYITALTGGGRSSTAMVAALLLAVVVGLTVAGARIGTTAQMAMVGLLLTVLATAVIWSLPSARIANWTPFTPHGWNAVGSAASVLMLSFIGWEAVAPLTRRLSNPRKDLPRITWSAFVLTTVIYLALAATVIGVLGPGGDTAEPIAGLMLIALGRAGLSIVAVAAALLTLATVNVYLTGAVALAARLSTSNTRGTAAERSARPGTLLVFVAVAGFVELVAEATGLLDPARMITLPTALFLVVYIGSTASAARILTGPLRVAAVLACAASAVILGFCGLMALFALLVVAVALSVIEVGTGRSQKTSGIGGEGDGRVTELVLDDLQVGSGGQGQRCGAVP